MRQLKFRVWTGTGMEYNIMAGKFGVFYVNPLNNGIDENDSASLTTFNTKLENEVMQSTGMVDENGNEIYEGDVVTFESYTGNQKYKGHVVYCEKDMMFKFQDCERITYRDKSFTYEKRSRVSYHSFKVIGNIHQNPDFLK